MAAYNHPSGVRFSEGVRDGDGENGSNELINYTLKQNNIVNSFKISCFSLCNLGERVGSQRCTSHVITGCNYDLSSSDESYHLNCLSLQSLSLREEACILSGGAALTQSLRCSPPSSIVPKFKDRPTL